MNQRSSVILSILGILFVICWQVGFSDIFTLTRTSEPIHETYSITSHYWINGHGKQTCGTTLVVVDLIPPDLFSMIFASPWLGLGMERGVAYDLSIVTQVMCNVAAGWYLGKVTGGSPWVAPSPSSAPHFVLDS